MSSRGPRRKGIVEPVGYDYEGGSECHVSMRDLEREFDAADACNSDWLYEVAAFKDCAERLAISSFNRWGTMRNHRNKKPANDNGRSS
jgi:hypothetical protein